MWFAGDGTGDRRDLVREVATLAQSENFLSSSSILAPGFVGQLAKFRTAS